MSVKIHIVYCGGRGYAPKFRKIKQELEAKFGDKVEVTGEGTPDTTGYLEVEIVGGAVLHSKKNGDGHTGHNRLPGGGDRWGRCVAQQEERRWVRGHVRQDEQDLRRRGGGSCIRRQEFAKGIRVGR